MSETELIGGIEVRVTKKDPQIPEPPEQKKYSCSEIKNVLQNEGLAYAVTCYMASDQIADPKLAKLWDECANKIDELNSYIEKHSEEEDDDV